MAFTLIPTKVPLGYFSDKNVKNIRNKIKEILLKSFDKPVIIDDNSIRRVMQRVLDERLEPYPLMEQRIIMYIVSEFKQFELEKNKNLRYERFFPYTQLVYDNTARSGPDMQTIKLSRQPSTLRFYNFFSL